MWFSRFFTARYWTARYFSATGAEIIILPSGKITSEGFFVSASTTGNLKALSNDGFMIGLSNIGKFK